MLEADFSKVLRLEPDRRQLKVVAGIGWDMGIVGSAMVEAGSRSQAGFTLVAAGPVLTSDLAAEKRFSGPPLLTDHGVVSGVSVLIGPDDSPWGVLGVHSRKKGAFTHEDSNFVQSVANVLWEAIARQEIEEKLRDSEARITAFLNSSTVLAWMKDAEGRFVMTSGSFNRTFNTKPEDWLGKTDYDFMPRELADPIHKNDMKVLETGEVLQASERASVGSGEIREYVVSKFAFQDSAGDRFVGGLGVDITEQVRIEKALAESEERLRLAAKLAGFGTYFIDCAQSTVSWSPEFNDIVGVESENGGLTPLGETPDFVHKEDRNRVEKKIFESLDPQSTGEISDEHRVVRPDGEERWVLMRGKTVFEGDGAARRAIRNAGVLIDITQSHQIEEELVKSRAAAQHANQAKSQFLANVSHEIRTPMTAILGYADILLSHLQDPDNINAVRTIKQNGDYLCEILNDILDLSKIEAGKLELRSQETPIISLLADVRSLMAVPAGRKDIQLRIEFASDLPASVLTDAKAVRQVLINLVSNAIKFTSDGEVRVVVSCDRDAQQIVIDVVDTGVGIDADTQSRIFEPFQQADNSATREFGGTGLGLAISAKLANMLGGSVEVLNSELNRGSTFRFRFATGPLDNRDWITPSAEKLKRVIEVDLRDRLPKLSARVLTIDDRRDVRFLVQHFVEAAGAEVVTAADGAQGVDAWRQRRDTNAAVDVILMDMHMPVMDGLEATRRLREEGFDGPIIALTADTMAGDREKCIEAGCTAFVSKPIDRGDLINAIADVLDGT